MNLRLPPDKGPAIVTNCQHQQRRVVVITLGVSDILSCLLRYVDTSVPGYIVGNGFSLYSEEFAFLTLDR